MDLVVAVFDVDGTLTVRDCVVPFTRRIAGTPRLAWEAIRNVSRLVPLVMKRDRDAVKTLFCDLAFAGKNVEEVEAQGVIFANHMYHTMMRADVAQRFRWHQQQGHVVVLVSASLEPYLIPFGELLEADAVLCTSLDSRDGIYTGALRGNNCRGEEKVLRLTQWCTEAGIPLDAIGYAYGDSAGDEPMLAMSAQAFYVANTELEDLSR